MNKKSLEQKLNEQKNKIGLVSGTINLETYDEMEHPISASISPEDWNIQVSIRKGFNPIKDRRQRAYARVKKIEDGLETLVLHVGGLHEPAHWELPVDSGKGCPYDEYQHDKILEAVKQALPENKQQHTSYVANAFEDTIINPRCKEWNTDFSGQVLFWDWEGLTIKESGKEQFTPFYEAFVKLNIYLWGDNIDVCLLKRHYSDNQQVNSAVEKTIQDLNLQEDLQDTSVLFEKQRWPEMARIFTENLVDLLEETPSERLSAFESGENGKKEQSGNQIEQKTKTRKGKEEIAFGRYIYDEQQSPNITSYEQLDVVYRRLARDIPIQVEAITREHSLEIVPLTYKPFDPETDDPTKIKTSKLFLVEQRLTFAYPDKPLTVEQRSKIQRRSFPDFKMVVLDNSRSMAEAPDGSNNIGKINFIPWGDNSKYHYALLGFYGIENFLQRQGIAQYIQHGLSLFSSQTRYRESDFQGLDEVRKHALSPEWGSTNLDAEVLTEALKERESFVLSISDGAIGNWRSTKSEFETLARNNYFAHIQIGTGTTFTSDLESWEIPVFYVSTGEDLSHLMVDVTKQVYERFTKQ